MTRPKLYVEPTSERYRHDWHDDDGAGRMDCGDSRQEYSVDALETWNSMSPRGNEASQLGGLAGGTSRAFKTWNSMSRRGNEDAASDVANVSMERGLACWNSGYQRDENGESEVIAASRRRALELWDSGRTSAAVERSCGGVEEGNDDGDGNVRLCQADVDRDFGIGLRTTWRQTQRRSELLGQLYATKEVVDWPALEKEIDALTGMATTIGMLNNAPGLSGAFLYPEYNKRFKAVVEKLVTYFHANKWEYAEAAYKMYLRVEEENTDVLRLPFSKIRAHIADIPSLQGVFDDWRAEAMAYARSQPCDNPQAKPLGEVEVPENPLYYCLHADVGLVLGHYAVSARVAPRGRAALGKMKWQLYFEVTQRSADFDFDDPNKRLPIPRLSKQKPWIHYIQSGDFEDLCRTEVPAFLFWTAEKCTGRAEPFPVYSHELSEVFVCECTEQE